MKIFNTAKFQLLKRSLDVYTKQHENIASNVANANNPDYKRLNTDFSQVLSNQVSRTLQTDNERHIPSPIEADPTRKLDKEAAEKEIDLSMEMAQLAENQIRFDFAARALKQSYRALTMSITGRNG